MSRNYDKPVYRYRKDLKWLVVAAAASFAMIVLYFFTYCRAESDALFVRDMGTLFTEKWYEWESVDSVKITYHQNTRGGDYSIPYWINFDRYPVNLQDDSLPVSGDVLERSRKAIHRIINSYGFPVTKDSDGDDREIRRYLDGMEEW